MTRPSSRLLLALAITLVIVGLTVAIVFLRRRASHGLEVGTPVSVSTPSSDPVPVVGSQKATSTILEYTAPPKKTASPRPEATVSASGTASIAPSTPADTNSSTTSVIPLRLNIDSDADGVSDQDETETYRTDPRKADTDGDSYPDGEEIEKGYNPLGPGRCAQPSCIPSV